MCNLSVANILVSALALKPCDILVINVTMIYQLSVWLKSSPIMQAKPSVEASCNLWLSMTANGRSARSEKSAGGERKISRCTLYSLNRPVCTTDLRETRRRSLQYGLRNNQSSCERKYSSILRRSGWLKLSLSISSPSNLFSLALTAFSNFHCGEELSINRISIEAISVKAFSND